jgi:predicted ATPase
MITELRLENWKSFETDSLFVDSLSVLIGANASGKSNALDGFALLNRTTSGTMLTAALQGDSLLGALRGGVEWAALSPGNRFAIGLVCRVSGFHDYEYRLECRVVYNRCEVFSEQLTRLLFRSVKNGIRQGRPSKIHLFWTDLTEEDAPTVKTYLYNEKGGTTRQLGRANTILFQLLGQSLRREIEEGVAEVISALRGIFILDPIPSHMRHYSPLSDRLESDASNIAGVLAGLLPEQQKEIEQVITKFASRLPERDILRFYAEKVGKFASDAMLYCEEHWLDRSEPHTVDARGMSDGTLRFLAILTALMTRPRGSLLVIEEVDNGLHPSRAGLLLEMLREIGGQQGVDVLVTTHNPALLDAMGTEMVPYITVAHRDPMTGHSVLTLLEDIERLPKLLAQGPIGRLSSQGLIEESLSGVGA